jgi:hypothetical protein
MRYLLPVFLLFFLLNSSFAQQKLEGRYDAAHKIFFPKDARYWVEPFTEGIAKYTYRDLVNGGGMYRSLWGLGNDRQCREVIDRSKV